MNNKVLLVNEGLSDNLGDQAIRAGAQHGLRQLGFHVDFADYTRSGARCQTMPEDPSKDVFGRSWSPKNLLPRRFRWVVRNAFRIIDRVKGSYRAIVIGGGQLLRPNGKFPVAFFTWIIAARLLSRSEIYVIGVGVEPMGWFDRTMVRYALTLVHGVAVRDQISAQIAGGLLGRPVDVVPDWAYLIDRIFPSPPDSLPALVPNRKGVALINVPYLGVYQRYRNGDATRETYHSIWGDICRSHLNKGRAIRAFYTTAEDKYEAYRFYDFLVRNGMSACSVAECESLGQLVSEVQRSEVVCSGRMHALILAQVYGIPIEPFLISKKIESFVASLTAQHSPDPAGEKLMSYLRTTVFRRARDGDMQ